MQTGLCTNIGNCSKADSGEKIQVPVGGQFVCPECNRELARVGGPARAGGGGRSAIVLAAVVLVLLALVFAAWKFFGGRSETAITEQNGTATEEVPEEVKNAEVILRLHGSNTVGSKLAPKLAEAFLKAQGAKNIQVVQGENPVEKTVVGTLRGQSEPSAIEIAAHGSGTAFEDLEAGKTDIGMASRRIKDKEKQALASLGNMTSRGSEHVVGLDGLAIIANSGSPVEALTADQIRDIFTCKVTDWSQVGDSSGEIHLYARDDKSGTFDTFKELVLRGAELCDKAERFEDSSELAQKVADDAQGIGFVGMPYIIGGTRALKVSAGGSSVPMRPTALTVKTEDYLLSRRLFLYTPADPKNAWTRKFVEFALSDPGQEIVDDTGFVGQALTAEAIPEREEAVVATNLPPAYERLIRDAERLPFNFRFQTGSDALDNKSYRDLGRLVQFMSDRDYQDREVLLIGFADAQGSGDSNLELSRRRASSVERELQSEGIKPAVDGFGEELPVASNDTEEGREKNRRVEVWLRR